MRITYAKNKGPGQWKAHGRYLERESATGRARGEKSGFDRERQGLNLAQIVDPWQRAGDERLFKIIVSPEFGVRMDLVRHTRQLLARMERDLRTKLEWAAVTHFNTDHPHVHIVLRGMNKKGITLRLERDYIKHGVRAHAEELATNQLGYRTFDQVLNAQAKETNQQRFTSLDYLISKRREADAWLVPTILQGSHFAIQQRVQLPLQGLAGEEREYYLAARLRCLQSMGLALPGAGEIWYVRHDFEEILRAMLLEGTDAKIHLIYHTEEIDGARAAGKLKPDQFAVLQKTFVEKRPKLVIEDLGAAEDVLTNPSALRQAARRLIRQGVFAELQQTAWGGWLGKYHDQVRRAGEEELQRQKRRMQGR